MIALLIFVWPYVLLSVFVWEHKRKGSDVHDNLGFIGAGIGLAIMTTGLLLFPRVYTLLTGDHSANIGWGILCLASIAYCYFFLVGGYRLGRKISMGKTEQ